LGILNLQNGILTGKIRVSSAAPRSIAVSFPFHITMVDDGTQQHHEHPLSAAPFKPSSVTIFIGKL
jgi:hypothetical protein